MRFRDPHHSHPLNVSIHPMGGEFPMTQNCLMASELNHRGTPPQNLIMSAFENPWTRYLHIRAEVVDALSEAGWGDQDIAQALSMPLASAGESLKRSVPDPLHGKYLHLGQQASEWLENYYPSSHEVCLVLAMEGPDQVRKLLSRDRRLDRTTASQVVFL